MNDIEAMAKGIKMSGLATLISINIPNSIKRQALYELMRLLDMKCGEKEEQEISALFDRQQYPSRTITAHPIPKQQAKFIYKLDDKINIEAPLIREDTNYWYIEQSLSKIAYKKVETNAKNNDTTADTRTQTPPNEFFNPESGERE